MVFRENVIARMSLTGNDLANKVDKLMHQGNVKRIRIIHMEKPILDISLNIHDATSDIPVYQIPVRAAVSKIAELINYCTIEIEFVDRSIVCKNYNY